MVRDAIDPALAAAREAMRASGTGRAELAPAPHAADVTQGPSVRWLARDPEPALAPLDAVAAAALRPREVEAAAERLAVLDEAAATRAARRLVGRASEQASDARREAASERAEGTGEARAPGDAEREVATAVGTAVHALLERLDWSAPDRDAAWNARLAEARAALDRVVSPAFREAARARADAILEALRRGPLFALLERHAAHSIARELGFVMPSAPSETGAVAAWVGAIDWIYWDADAGCVVVVDFKTDRVEGDADIAARVAHHRPQAERYALAARQALALESLPRVELWFLAAGRREEVAIGPG
jgi:ATP-dependent exoDNAse (exonuclease V) beta subunit